MPTPLEIEAMMEQLRREGRVGSMLAAGAEPPPPSDLSSDSVLDPTSGPGLSSSEMQALRMFAASRQQPSLPPDAAWAEGSGRFPTDPRVHPSFGSPIPVQRPGERGGLLDMFPEGQSGPMRSTVRGREEEAARIAAQAAAATTPPPPPPAAPTTLAEDINRESPHAPVPPRTPTRAILLPGGRILYTNTSDYDRSGTPISMSDAGRMGRDQDRAVIAAEDAAISSPEEAGIAQSGWRSGTNFDRPRFSPITSFDPTSDSMRALVRSAAKATADADAAGRPVSPGVSMIEGTPQQQHELRFEHALQAAALARVEQEQKIAEMSPQDAARLGQPPDIYPLLQKITEYGIGAQRSISDPSNPNFIKDEKARAVEMQRLEEEMKTRRENVLAAAGLKVPAPY